MEEEEEDSFDFAVESAELKRVFTISEDEKILQVSDENICGIQKKKEVIAALRNLLVKNKDRLLLLFSVEKEFTLQLVKCSAELSEITDQIAEQEHGNKKGCCSFPVLNFGTPYFKLNNTVPSENADGLELQKMGDIKYVDIPKTEIWLDWEKEKVVKKLIKAERRRQETDINLDILRIKKVMENTSNEDKLSVFTKELQTLSERKALIAKKTLSELMMDSNGKYDWLRLANKSLKGRHLPQECESIWNNYLHPRFHKGRWTPQEDQKLKSLVDKHALQNWDAIATELNTSRSAFQCMCHYQTRLNPKLSKKNWDENDDSSLILLVEKLRRGDYIPWKKVAYCFNSCPVTNVIARWRTINPVVVKGKFSEAEDICLVAAVKKFGKNFKKIADHFPGRTSTQLMERYRLFVKVAQNKRPWTPEDDRLIWEKVQQFGNSFSRISQFFIDRDRTQVRHRYYRMLDWLEKHPDQEYPTCRSGTLKVADGPDELWTKALTLMKDRRVKVKEIDGEAVLDNKAFSNLTTKMKVFNKPGKKTGRNKNFPKIDLEIAKYFSCLYPQIGGRNKIHFTSEEIENDYCAILKFLDFLGAQLTGVSEDSFKDDERFSAIDHLVLKKIILHNSENSSISKSSTTDATPSSSSATPKLTNFSHCNLCNVNHSRMSYINVFHNTVPPNQTTLVGIRSIMLWRNVLKSDSCLPEDKLEGTLDESSSSNQHYTSTAQTSDADNFNRDNHTQGSECPNATFLKHSELWKARFRSLFSWAALCSENGPKVLPNSCSLCGEEDTRNIPEHIMDGIRDKESKRNAATSKKKRTK